MPQHVASAGGLVPAIIPGSGGMSNGGTSGGGGAVLINGGNGAKTTHGAIIIGVGNGIGGRCPDECTGCEKCLENEHCANCMHYHIGLGKCAGCACDCFSRTCVKCRNAPATALRTGYYDVRRSAYCWDCGIVQRATEYDTQRKQRKVAGVCLDCGDRGEIRMLACFCRNGHGMIWG